MCGGVSHVSSVGLLNSEFCWIDAYSYGTQDCASQFALSFPLFLWFRNPTKNYPWSQNNYSQKTTDNCHPNLLNLSVIILYYGKEHMGTHWQFGRLTRGDIHALLWKTSQL